MCELCVVGVRGVGSQDPKEAASVFIHANTHEQMTLPPLDAPRVAHVKT